MIRTLLPLAVSALLAGCASKQLPEQQLLDTHAAIDSAQEVDTEDDPTVALHIRYAQDQLTIAKSLLEDGKEKRAHRMLDRANADAELALALAKTARSQEAARAAWSDVNELRNQ